MRYVAAFFILVAVIGPMIDWRASHDAPPRKNEPSAVSAGGGMPAPSALHESGITPESPTPAPVKVLSEQRSVAKPRAPVRSARPRPGAGGGVALPARPLQGSVEARGSADARMSGLASKAQTQTSNPDPASPSAAATGGTDLRAAQQIPSQPVSESPPPVPVTAPQAASPAPAVLTPPVPIDLAPPTHPLPYRMIVDAPGLSSTARLEAIEARVRLRLVVRADGSVAAVDVVFPSGRRELDTAAREAARAWRFLPARRDGEPIDSVALIWVSFVAGP